MSEPNYQEAFEELQQIVSEMEEGQISVDELTEKVARAASLIRICKTKLNVAEQNVEEILSAIENQEIMDNPDSQEDKPEEDVMTDGEDDEVENEEVDVEEDSDENKIKEE